MVGAEALRKRKAACKAELLAWLGSDEDDVQEQSTAQERTSPVEQPSEPIGQLATFDDSEIVNMEAEDREPFIEISDEEHPSEWVYNHDLTDVHPKRNLWGKSIRPYSSTTERLYERWEELLPNLTAP